jgi:guanylate kinase
MTTSKKLQKALKKALSIAKRKKGTLFVISGPSGCGKTTLCNRLLSSKLGLVRSVSATTRQPRKGERNNIDYIFTTKERFLDDASKNSFLEHAEVFGNYYGTPRSFVMRNINQVKDVLLSIDVQGAAQIKKAFKDAVLIFIMPPTLKALKSRLKKRASDSKSQISKRLHTACSELEAIDRYDYVVVNERIQKAAADITAIIRSVRHKR